MSKESIPQHNAHVLEEERKGIADSLAEQDTIRRCDAESSAAALKHEQKIEAKQLKHDQKDAAKKLEHQHDHAKQNAQDIKDTAKANAEKLKV